MIGPITSSVLIVATASAIISFVRRQTKPSLLALVTGIAGSVVAGGIATWGQGPDGQAGLIFPILFALYFPASLFGGFLGWALRRLMDKGRRSN